MAWLGLRDHSRLARYPSMPLIVSLRACWDLAGGLHRRAADAVLPEEDRGYHGEAVGEYCCSSASGCGFWAFRSSGVRAGVAALRLMACLPAFTRGMGLILELIYDA